MDRKRRGAERICEALRAAGHQTLFAGGCVRDALLGIEPSDYDIATSATPDQVEAIFDRTVGVGKAFGVILVLLDDHEYEVATFRSDGPYLDGRHPSSVDFTDARGDAERRDFTVNAMFYDPETDEVLDFVGGRADLDRRVIQTVGDPRARFEEDHLRLIRALRFSIQLDFTIETRTLESIRTLADRITRTSSERIRDELTKMFTRGSAKRGIELMNDAGLLEPIFPEVARMQGVQQPPEFHPEGDVYVHTLLALDELQSPSLALTLATLLHDVGKPDTQTFEDRIRFNGHEALGAEMAGAICRRLRFSTAITDRVQWIVSQHMRVAHARDMRLSKAKRLVREEGFPELLQLFQADCRASHGQMDAYEWLREFSENLPEEAVRPDPLLRGEDLIAMGYQPGPLFKEILTAIEDAQLEGELSDAEAAREHVLRRWPRTG